MENRHAFTQKLLESAYEETVVAQEPTDVAAGKPFLADFLTRVWERIGELRGSDEAAVLQTLAEWGACEFLQKPRRRA